MDTQILAKIKKANVLTPDELLSLESKLSPAVTPDAKSPKDEVAPVTNPTPTVDKVATPKDNVPPVDAPIPAPKLETVAPTETPIESATAGGSVTPEATVGEPTETPEVPPLLEGADTPENPTQDIPDVPEAAATPNVAVTPADLEQMKTTLGALESKISNLEEVLSKLSVTQEPEETDFGISGKGKTAGGGEPIRDRAADLVKKMGGFSNNY